MVVENLPTFAALILVAHAAGTSDAVTSGAGAVYFFGMRVYCVVLTFGIPYLRTLAFLVAGFGVEMALASTLLGIL